MLLPRWCSTFKTDFQLPWAANTSAYRIILGVSRIDVDRNLASTTRSNLILEHYSCHQRGVSNAGIEYTDSSVQCPICDRSVPESEINLHLDLQCPGSGGPSSPLPEVAKPVTQRKLGSSQGSDGPIVIDTPTAKPKLQPTTSGRLAPTFAGMKRAADDSNGNGEKKPRVNALTANQPYVWHYNSLNVGWRNARDHRLWRRTSDRTIS